MNLQTIKLPRNKEIKYRSVITHTNTFPIHLHPQKSRDYVYSPREYKEHQQNTKRQQQLNTVESHKFPQTLNLCVS